ncbi:hypothetical protein IGS75_01560 [Gluconobacter sphaericus]|uniref:hypothetical protein n=1 Tax=Gluconobacter sphaericus TaxID=574987 RepID=UPI001924E609|nr:hypothetical protein [Gluconobacter sphaericus]QQX91357.1 hypothetical protein IGS75_01560 [Gluconobacter sphaericus]
MTNGQKIEAAAKQLFLKENHNCIWEPEVAFAERGIASKTPEPRVPATEYQKKIYMARAREGLGL